MELGEANQGSGARVGGVGRQGVAGGGAGGAERVGVGGGDPVCFKGRGCFGVVGVSEYYAPSVGAQEANKAGTIFLNLHAFQYRIPPLRQRVHDRLEALQLLPQLGRDRGVVRGARHDRHQ